MQDLQDQATGTALLEWVGELQINTEEHPILSSTHQVARAAVALALTPWPVCKRHLQQFAELDSLLTKYGKV